MNHRYSIFKRTAILAGALGLGGGLLISQAWADDVDVKIEGIYNPLLTNVRKSLSVAGKHEEPWSPEQVQRLYRLAPKEITKALEPYGYYTPKIDTQLHKPEGDGLTWQAAFKIDHGPATKVTALTIQANGPGDQLEALQQAMESTDLKTGKRLVQAQYTATKSAMYNAAYQAGYLDAKFSESAIRVNPETHSAEIALVLDTGERYYFGNVTFDQDLLKDSFVQKFVPFSAGEPYDAEKLIDMQLILSDTDYYNQIEIKADHNKAQRVGSMDQWFYDLLYPPEDPLHSVGQLRVPVVVTATPSKGQSYEFSAGYGTDTGPRVGVGLKFRHLNQYGHQFRTDLRVSQIQRSLQAAYDIPIQNVAKDKLSFTAQITNQDYGDITSTLYGVGALRDTGWALGRKRAYINLERETYDLGDGNQTSTLFYPGYTLTGQKADNLLFTHKGFSFSADVHGGSSAVLSSTDFVRGDLSGHLVLPVTSKGRFLARAEFGAIGVNDFQDLPPSQRFFAGGDRSVRGYSYQSISPTNSDNEDIGGRYLAVGSVEGNYFFYKKFGAAIFADAGDASNSTNFDFKKSAGIGFRWASPVGMIRLDVAHPFDDPDSNFRIHFSLGPDL